MRWWAARRSRWDLSQIALQCSALCPVIMDLTLEDMFMRICAPHARTRLRIICWMGPCKRRRWRARGTRTSMH